MIQVEGKDSKRPNVQLKNISRRFGKIEVLRDISFSLRRGEVVGLVGDNGAGKSTLVKIISGYLRPTSGKMEVRGQEIQFSSPRHSRKLGIETVYQDLAIIGQLSLWRNFFLGKEKKKKIFGISVLDRNAMKKTCLEQLRSFGLKSVNSANQSAENLSGGERQTLAIARAVYFESRLLILDEPVAALSVRETRKVMEMIQLAKSQKIAILYIDHNMNHVVPVADRIAVVEHGEIKRVVRRGEMTANELSDLVAQSGPN